MATSKTFQIFPGDTWGMGVTEYRMPQSVVRMVIPAHKGKDAEPIGECPTWHPETQGRQRDAVASNGRHWAALLLARLCARFQVASPDSRLLHGAVR